LYLSQVNLCGKNLTLLQHLLSMLLPVGTSFKTGNHLCSALEPRG
jgi:hypothetical protein